jgi:hypothetical protein
MVVSQLIRTGAITLAIFGSVGFAAAKQWSGSTHIDLTPTQGRMVGQGLAASPSQQPAPGGAQPKVGGASLFPMPAPMRSRSF